MRTLILIAILLASLIISAQDSIPKNGCKADFDYAVNTEIMTMGIAPATAINFFDHSEGKVLSWMWDFGDGQIGFEQNPLHIYIHPIFDGSIRVKINPYRTITLTILTADSCKSSYSKTINIYDQYTEPDIRCKALFKHYTLSYDSIGGTETFQFSNRSEGESLSYLWQFDNGETSTEPEPTYTCDFSQPMRKVSLTITGSDGCTDTFGEDVFVDYPGGGGSEPGDSSYNGCFVAFGYNINYDYQTFLAALTLDFYAKANDEITSWNWDFGDGTTSNEPNPTHSFNYPIIKDSILGYPNPFRKVSLTVTTAKGCESTWSQTINIYTGKDPDVSSCHPWFKGYIPNDIVTIPELIPFQFSEGSEGDVVSWLWQFEDGSTRTDREPLVMFDFSKPTQYVCLTITTSDSCTSTWCETIYVTPEVIDSFIYVEPICNYTFKYTSAYPEWASACIGTATAKVVLNDSAISTDYYYWTSGNGSMISESQEAKNLCPTQTYTVTAKTTDGCKFSSSFIFNSDGTVTEIPLNWWNYRAGNDSYISYNRNNDNYTAEWVLCDGTVISCDSIPLNKINCGSSEANFVVKDGAGNTVYSEKIALKADIVSNKEINTITKINFYPVPVVNVLNVKYSDKSTGSIRFEVSDLNGKTLLKQNYRDVKPEKGFSVDVSTLQKGIYLGKIISGNKIIAVEKFSK